MIFGDLWGFLGHTDLKDGIAKAASEEAVVSDGRRDATRGITVQEHNAGQQVDAVQVTLITLGPLIFCMKTWCCTNLLPLQSFWHMLQGGRYTCCDELIGAFGKVHDFCKLLDGNGIHPTTQTLQHLFFFGCLNLEGYAVLSINQADKQALGIFDPQGRLGVQRAA